MAIADLDRPAAEVVGVAGLAELVGALQHLLGGHVAELERNFLKAHDLQALAIFDRADEGGGIVEAFVRAGVEPGEAAPKPGDVERTALEIGAIDVGDLKLAAIRRL